MMCVTGIATPLKFLTNRFGRSSEAQHRLENEQCVLCPRAVSGLCAAAASPSLGTTGCRRASGRDRTNAAPSKLEKACGRPTGLPSRARGCDRSRSFDSCALC